MTAIDLPTPIVPLRSVQDFIERADHRLLIGGAQSEPHSGQSFETLNPATGEVLARVASAGEQDVDRAVRSSHEALSGPWSKCTAHERERMLHRFADLLEAHAGELAQLDSLDSGKPVRQIEAVDVPLAIGQLRYNAGWPSKLEGGTLPEIVAGTQVRTRKEPLGVVAAIVPWNFPLSQACFKLAPALAAGCTVVLKPAEQTPLTALRLGEFALEAGIPAGVLNVVTGDGRTGAALVEHSLVAKVAFTGSEAVGRDIARRAAETFKHVSLELGGKSPNIVMPDADASVAAAAAATAIFFYAGQVCSAGSRLMVHRDIHDDVVAGVVEEARKLRLGPGMDETTTLGPLISDEQRTRVSRYVEGAVANGATVATGGGRPGGALADGYFHEPTVLTEVSDKDVVVKEEIFGPVLVVQPFESLEEVARRANATSFGLAAGIWTNDLRTAHRLSDALQAGTVWINTYNNFDAAAPWGGYKHSGYGRDGGREGVEKYLQTKTIWTGVG